MAQQTPNNNQFYINEMFNDGRSDTKKGIRLRERIFKENCGNLSADKSENRTNFIQNNEKVRFLVLGLGLQGSGKTSGFKQARDYCKLLNSAAVRNNEWVSIEVSHDHQVATNKRYKIAVRQLFHNTKPDLWTEEVWNTSSDKLKKKFLKEMDELYSYTRLGTAVNDSDRNRRKFSSTHHAENIRKILMREHNLGLEKPGERRGQRKRDLEADFHSFTKKEPINNPSLNKIFNSPTYQNLKFSANQQKKIKTIKTVGGAAATYRNLRAAINDGKNIEYEALGTSFKTIRKIFDVIIQSTNNCEKYTYVVIAVLNVCSIKESYKRQLCRFFKQANTFVNALRQGNSWNWSKSLVHPGAGVWETQDINDTNAPIIGIGRGGDTFKTKNEQLSSLIKQLISICNQPIMIRPNKYIGNCSGFGIDVLLLSHSKLDGSDGIIATLPLSIRSSRLIKSSQPGKFLQNKKYVHALVLYILNQLTLGTYNRNPLLNTNIDCATHEEKSDIDIIIDAFLYYWAKRGQANEKTGVTQSINIQRKSNLNKWQQELSKGGKKSRKKRRKRRKKRKTRKRRLIKKQKTRRKRH